MKKLYEDPTVEVQMFEQNDVITASGSTEPTAAPCDWELPED